MAQWAACAILTALASQSLSVLASLDGMCTSKPPPGEDCGSGSGSQHALQIALPTLHDISVTISSDLVQFTSETGLGTEWLAVVADMSAGAKYYASVVHLSVHTGTHVDAPSHFLKDQWDVGNTAHKLDLEKLVGPALVVEIPADKNITAEVLEALALPADCERILFKTGNTARGLMQQTAFASDYVAVTTSGARYLATKTNIKMIGIDYISVATIDDLIEAHEELLRKSIVPVEGLDLRALHPGRWYRVTCLPLKIKGAEGAPARCVAYGPDLEYEQDRLDADMEEDDEAWGLSGSQGSGERLSTEDEL